MILQVLPDQFRRFLIALAFQLAGYAARQEIFEVRAQRLRETRIAFSPAASGGIRSVDEGMAFSHPVQVADQAAMHVLRVCQIVVVSSIGVEKRNRQLGAPEVSGPAV